MPNDLMTASPTAVGILVDAAHKRLTEMLVTDGGENVTSEELAVAVDAYDVLVRLHRDTLIDPGAVIHSGKGGLIVSSEVFARQVAEAQDQLEAERRGYRDPGPDADLPLG